MNFIDKDFGLRVIFENSLQTIYTIDKENSDSRMILYHLYPGVDIILSDFKERYTWAGEWRLKGRIYQISYNCSGVYQAQIRKNEFCYASPGNLVILNSCKKSLDSKMTTDDLRGFSILLFPELFDQAITEEWIKQFDLDMNYFIELLPEIDTAKVFPCGEGILGVAEEIYKLLYNHKMGILKLKLLEFFHMIIKEDIKIENKKRVFSGEQIEKTKMIKELIEMDLSKHYTIQELCWRHEMSTTIFKECFKQMFQYPPYEFLRIARMNRAGEYLKNSDMSILDIGRLLGYENPSNFTRTFKEIYGVLPRQYRNSSYKEKCLK